MEVNRKGTEYISWANMIQRCRNEKHPQYKDYGGRGISIDKRWFKFENFYFDMGECPKGFTIDRVDVNGNYTKENCKWSDDYEQAWNQRKREDNKSGRVGVHWDTRKQKWISQIQVNGKRKQLIATEDFELACFCREEAELTYYGSSKENL